MKKTILMTGSTDGIGLEASRTLVAQGHHVLLHGRNATKLGNVENELAKLGTGSVETVVADLSQLADVAALAESITKRCSRLDVLVNNAGVFKTAELVTPDQLDVRFAVNAIAPFLLTKRLLPLLGSAGRIVNLSSAAQAPVDEQALRGDKTLSDGAAYAQSKLALTMWSRSLALLLGDDGPTIVAVNPGSMLGTKMVKEAFGVAGADLKIGAEIICRAALDEEFASSSGLYFDNDIGRFGPPHSDALDPTQSQAITGAIESIVAKWL